jgi:hypothetical protein
VHNEWGDEDDGGGMAGGDCCHAVGKGREVAQDVRGARRRRPGNAALPRVLYQRAGELVTSLGERCRQADHDGWRYFAIIPLASTRHLFFHVSLLSMQQVPWKPLMPGQRPAVAQPRSAPTSSSAGCWCAAASTAARA